MEKLYEKMDNLKDILDETECVKELKRLNREINQDKDFIKLIEDYKNTNDERLRDEILSNKLFREYKHQEAELNFLILEINQKLKQISKKDKCGL